MNKLKSLIMPAFACLLVVVAAVPAVADEVIPEEWLGVWEMEIASYDCDTNELLFSTTVLDTVCPGAVLEDPEPGSFTVDCTSSINGNTYTNHCEGSQEVYPGCTVSFVFDSTGTWSGDTFTQTTTSTNTYTGCIGVEDSCMRTEVNGTRMSIPDDPCEATPVVSQAWATVKAAYR